MRHRATLRLLLASIAIACGCTSPVGDDPVSAHPLGATPGERFVDVDGHWAQDAIEVLARHAVERRGDRFVLVRAADGMRPVVRGDQGAFRPDDVLTREELAALVLASRPDLDAAHDAACRERMDETLGAYGDVDRASPWAARALCVSVASGVLRGRANDAGGASLAPDAPVTHSELLAALRRVFDWYQPTFERDASNALEVDCGELGDARALMYCDGIRDEVMGYTSSTGWDWALVHFALRRYLVVAEHSFGATDLATDHVTRAEAAASLYVAFSHAFAFEVLRERPPLDDGPAFDDDDGCIPTEVARRIVGADHHVGEVPDAGDRDEGHDSLGNNLCR